MNEQNYSLIPIIVEGANAAFVFAAGMAMAIAVAMVIQDKIQTKDPIRRKYPLVGRFPGCIDWMGKFWRSHISSPDRGELPFNRAERESVKKLADQKSDTSAFGSTRNLERVGAPIFVNCAFPTMDEDGCHAEPLVIGPDCPNPYLAKSIFNISAMSYGSISKPAVQAFSRGAKMADCWLNTGEGGVSPYHLEGGADLVFQIGTAKYGVRDSSGRLDKEKLRDVASHDHVKMIEIKLSQGAKPGKGGILPGIKVTKEIAAIRGIREGEASNSPNRHPDIGSVAELLDHIKTVKEITGKPVGFKSVIGAYGWIEELCGEIARRDGEGCPDFITIDGGDGGTGAAPMALMDNVGLPLREALPMVASLLAENGLKDRIRIIASGKLVTAASVASAFCAGADFVNSARGFMFAIGCVQAMRCDKNTCPSGVTTSNPKLQKGLNPEDKAVKVANYCLGIVKEVETIAYSCGVSDPRKLRPYHVRIVQDDGHSVAMDEIHPRLKF